MIAYIYIHSNGGIVKSFSVDISCLSDLDKYFEEAKLEYDHKDGLFCFDVMIISRYDL